MLKLSIWKLERGKQVKQRQHWLTLRKSKAELGLSKSSSLTLIWALRKQRFSIPSSKLISGPISQPCLLRSTAACLKSKKCRLRCTRKAKMDQRLIYQMWRFSLFQITKIHTRRHSSPNTCEQNSIKKISAELKSWMIDSASKPYTKSQEDTWGQSLQKSAGGRSSKLLTKKATHSSDLRTNNTKLVSNPLLNCSRIQHRIKTWTCH